MKFQKNHIFLLFWAYSAVKFVRLTLSYFEKSNLKKKLLAIGQKVNLHYYDIEFFFAFLQSHKRKYFYCKKDVALVKNSKKFIKQKIQYHNSANYLFVISIKKSLAHLDLITLIFKIDFYFLLYKKLRRKRCRWD